VLFRELKKDTNMYVDKTKYILKLIFDTNYRLFHLSRPPRFGKSLFLDTIETFFNGDDKIFKNTYAQNKVNYRKFGPVLKFDFKNLYKAIGSSLNYNIISTVNFYASKFKIKLINNKNFIEVFSDLILKIRKNYKMNASILIDNSDFPIIEAYTKDNSFLSLNLGIINKFYSFLYDLNSTNQIEYVFSVSTFNCIDYSLFSGEKSFIDISLLKGMSSVCGFTKKEFDKYFLNILNKNYFTSSNKGNFDKFEDLIKFIEDYYGGYSWDGQTEVFNPGQISEIINNNNFENLKCQDILNKFIYQISKGKQKILSNLNKYKLIKMKTYNINIENPKLLYVLLQAGILSVGNIIYNNKIFDLRITNRSFEDDLKILIENS
jgi:hypothetical protein